MRRLSVREHVRLRVLAETCCECSTQKKAATIKSSLLFLPCEFVVGRAGFEPATNGLKVRCSTS
jgi:hypothetical protein